MSVAPSVLRLTQAERRDPVTCVRELVADFSSSFAALIDDLSARRTTRLQFVERATSMLLNRMRDAVGCWSDRLQPTPATERVLSNLVAARSDYLDRLALQVMSGDLSPAQQTQRAELWAGLVWAASQAAKVHETPPPKATGAQTATPSPKAAGAQTAVAPAKATGAQTAAAPLWAWALDAGAAHCDDCEAYAAGGPYTDETLPAYPGDGSTACSGNCRCELVPAVAATFAGAAFALAPACCVAGPVFALGGVS